MISKILFLFLFTTNLTPAFATCPAPQSPVPPSIEQISKALCATDQKELAAHPMSLTDAFFYCGAAMRKGEAEAIKGFLGIGPAVVSAAPTAARLVTEGALVMSGDYTLAMEIDRAAQTDAERSQSFVQKTQARAQAAQMLARGLWDNLSLVYETEACAPWTERIHDFCFVFSNVVVNMVPIDTIATAANKTVAVSQVVTKLLHEANLVPELKGLSITQKIDAAANALRQAAGYQTLVKAGNISLLTKEHAINGNTLYYVQEFGEKNGQRVSEISPVAQDVNGAILSKTDTGHIFASTIANSSRGEFLVSGDIMDLGKVNYFPKLLSQAGDRYLSRVTADIKSCMRDGDFIFKNGGDEFVMVLKTKDPAAVTAFQKRVHAALAKDTELQSMFRDYRIAAKQAAMKLPVSERAAAVQEAARIRPSISMGAARVTGTDAWSHTLALADGQAAEIKAAAKLRRGASADKYGGAANGASTTQSRPVLDAQPDVLDPIDN